MKCLCTVYKYETEKAMLLFLFSSDNRKW
uniref:Uncharacterized protein n=1 Tax=Anguilla anguilla TaxID=7936 RepID=A0A0E9W6D2_ANGAN